MRHIAKPLMVLAVLPGLLAPMQPTQAQEHHSLPQTFQPQFKASVDEPLAILPGAAVGNRWDSAEEISVDRRARMLEEVGVRGRHLPDGPTAHALPSELSSPDIRNVSPSQVGNAGRATIKIVGGEFSPDVQVQLLGPDNAVIEGDEYYQDELTLFATFDLLGAGADPGEYDLAITNSGPESTTKHHAITVMAGGAPEFEASLVVAPIVRPGRVTDVRIQYANTGKIDLRSPLFIIEGAEDASAQPSWTSKLRERVALSSEEWAGASTVSALALSSDGPATILRPGQSQAIVVKPRASLRPGDTPFTLYVLGAPSGTGLDKGIDWEQLEQDLRPADTPSVAWDPLIARLRAQVGDTWGDYLVMLRDNADHLVELGIRVPDQGELLAFEFVQAYSMGAPPYLESALDAFCPAPGLPLSFERYFLPGPSYRAREGALGRGWTHSYENTLRKRSDGTIVINGPEGFDRFFQPDGDGSYVASPGDYAALTAEADGEFLLREKDGLQYHFQKDGLFDFIQDPNGNRTTAQYDPDERLAQVSHSSGDSFTFEYNTDGRLVSLTDHANRTTAYDYDDSGEHLLSVTRPDGEVTSYTYIAGEGLLADHNLTSTTRPGGLRNSFAYDSLGRLQEEHSGTDEESTQYAYSSAGKLHFNDALGNKTTIWLDGGGNTARIKDPPGATMDMTYDADSNLTSVVGPTGLASHFAYDDLGNRISVRHFMGNTTEFAYEDELSNLLWAQDARGNRTEYAYDSASNLVSITYPDGTVEYFAYDDQGNMTESTNRRRNTVTRAYDDRGQLTAKAYPDGIRFTYAYDEAGRLIAATDARGRTRLEYDADNDWLTKITYPEGRYLEFLYDEADRRIRVTGPDCFTVGYEHDEAGRLSKLTDADGNTIVTYTYDDAGRLIRGDKGNGTYTTYEYDEVGQLLHLINYAPDGWVNSRFDYTYDDLGRRTGMTTLDGEWAYEYDDNGQLIRAVFDSTSADIDDQDITYVYDAVGNRVRTIQNGITTEYATNSMNQYTTVGAATYEYDADGNMVSKTDAGDRWSYTYDEDSLLTQVLTPEGTWRFEYDAFGNRIATIRDRQRTEYLLDPASPADVVSEYHAPGSLIAHYVHGLGLTSRLTATGEARYYAFDAVGSVVGLSGPDGSYSNRYSYLPFGQRLASVERAGNPFTFVGRWGVMTESGGLHFMRARYYDSKVGRFIAEDPIGILGEPNLYLYTRNAPIYAIDPLGLFQLGTFLKGLATTVGGGIGMIACAAAAPFTGGASVLPAIATAYAFGTGIGNMVNAFLDTKPVLEGGLFGDIAKLSPSTEVRALGSLVDLALSAGAGTPNLAATASFTGLKGFIGTASDVYSYGSTIIEHGGQIWEHVGPGVRQFLGRIDVGEPGGIDFTSIELAYVSERLEEMAGAQRPTFQYVLRATEAQPGDETIDPYDAETLSLTWFLVGLSLPNHKFWVNLNPWEPDRVIDAALGRTDVGRVMLEADFQMKKDFSKHNNPCESEIGQDYRDLLDEKRRELVGECMDAHPDDIDSVDNVFFAAATRYWIVPDQITAHGDGDELYVADATLGIFSEPVYERSTLEIANQPGSLSQASRECLAEAAKEYGRYAKEREEEMILPLVVGEVNESSAYSDLRQVYASLALAQWYKSHYGPGEHIFSILVDSEGLEDLESAAPWSAERLWEEYVESYEEGEYHCEKEHREGNLIITQVYRSGGVDFEDIEEHISIAGPVGDEARAVLSRTMSEPFATSNGEYYLGERLSSPVEPSSLTPVAVETPTATPSGPEPPSPDDSLKVLAITLGVVGGLALLAALAFLFWKWRQSTPREWEDW